MAKRNYKYNATVDLSNVPRTKSGKNYMWRKSIGCIVPFTFDNGKLVGEFEIVDYKTPEGLMHLHIYLKYNGNLLKPISPMGLTNATFSNILDEYYIEWEYNIGDRLADDERDITIIDRKRIEDIDGYLVKRYKILCNRCGFDSGEYYINGEYREEWWVTEQDLKRDDERRVNCPCCSSHIVVCGINDIPTTAPWMVKYFQGGYDEAMKYTSRSKKEIFPICPCCGTIINKPTKIDSIYALNGISCACNDKLSYPNKFAYYTFRQLKGQYNNYIREYTPKWAGYYSYDNYIEKDDKIIIFEMDGGIGHGKYKYKSKERDTEGLKRDQIKDKLAKEHNIIVERVDCFYSEFYYIKRNLENCLNKYFDLSSIDWDLIEAQCRQANIYKEICEYYCNNKNVKQTDIAKHFNVGRKIVMSALKAGKKFGWCEYYTNKEQRNNNEEIVYQYWIEHPDTSTTVIGKNIGLSSSAVNSILKKLTSENKICYNPEKSIEINNQKNYLKKKVYVYSLEQKLLKIYSSKKECSLNSKKDFGKKFTEQGIGDVCLRKSKTYKGYIFSYEPLDDNFILEEINRGKPVYVYDLEMNFLKFYNSAKEAERKSIEDFGVQFIAQNISSVCTGKYKQHKGFIFSHTKLHND